MIQCKVCGWSYVPDDWENGRVMVPRHNFPPCAGGGVPVDRSLWTRAKEYGSMRQIARALGVLVTIWGVIWIFYSDVFPIAVAFSMVGVAIALLSYCHEDE